MTARFLEQRTVDPADLDPYPGNPNIGDVDAVRESLRTNGQYRAPVARLMPDGRLQVLAGHTTRLAAIAEAMPLRVDVVDAADATARRIVLADNRTAQLAHYDDTLLLSLLDAGDLTGTGWDEDAYRELLGGPPPLETAAGDPGAAGDDFDTTPPPEPVTQRGDVWLLGPHRLVCGDSTDLETWVTLLHGERIDLVWTDPPYGVSYQSDLSPKAAKRLNRRTDGKVVSNDTLTEAGLQDFLRAALGPALAASKSGACWYVAAPSGQQFLDFAVVLRELDIWRQTLVWVKDVFAFGRSDYHYRHESIFYGWKPGAAHRAVPDRTQDTVWEIARPKRSPEHPTMKPVELVTRALQNSSEKGQIVADPFGGSGPTIVAAHITGRVARVVELDPGYCDVIARRWQTLTSEHPVLRRTGEPVDLHAAHDGRQPVPSP